MSTLRGLPTLLVALAMLAIPASAGPPFSGPAGPVIFTVTPFPEAPCSLTEPCPFQAMICDLDKGRCPGGATLRGMNFQTPGAAVTVGETPFTVADGDSSTLVIIPPTADFRTIAGVSYAITLSQSTGTDSISWVFADHSG